MPKVILALGSNIQDRYANLSNALLDIRSLGEIIKTSFLYESRPMYFENQPCFLNAVCQISTELDPFELLSQVKNVEEKNGRKQTFRNGPRSIDVDILFYDSLNLSTPTLQIPHPKIQERDFVLKPLLDIEPNLIHPTLGESISSLFNRYLTSNEYSLVRILPFYNYKEKKSKLLKLDKKEIFFMGILNATPDSFSDGGSYQTLDDAVNHALQLERSGSNIIDIGGESTRPGADTVNVDEEINRVVPIIKGIRDSGSNIIISIDTRKSEVAKAALEAGADAINDVSAGVYDPKILNIACDFKTTFIAMHMRGTPLVMNSPPFTLYQDVVSEVTNELKENLLALDKFVPLWAQVIDPGIGFAKGAAENIKLIKPNNLRYLRSQLQDRPLLLGISRKRFISTIIENMKEKMPSSPEDQISIHERDLATAGLCCAAMLGDVDIIRVHNVKDISIICNSFKFLSFDY